MKTWETFFEEILQTFSTGDHEVDLLQAKESFFQKLGRSHEIRTDYFEAVSRSFLEWYIFDYQCQDCRKTPAVLFLARQYGEDAQRERLKQALFHHWSLYKVLALQKDQVLLQDLLIGKTRRLGWSREDSDFQLWKVKEGQVVQARLFQKSENDYFATHVWLHPETEYAELEKTCERLKSIWGLHRGFLRDVLESLIRSLDLSDQMRAVRSRNWIYQDLWKRYAQAK